MRDAPKSPLLGAIRLLVVATAVLYLVAAGIGAAGYIANSNRIADDRADRVRACELAYQSIVDVFEPFFPPKETERVKEFKATVARYVARCATQTS